MAAVAPIMEPVVFDMDKLSYEIFNILESKFLFGQIDNNNNDNSNNNIDFSMPATPVKAKIINNINNNNGKVRILSIDAGDAVVAAAALSSLESSLRRISGNSIARIADFFDLAAGSGAGGVLAAMLFTRDSNGNPLFSAEQALRFFLDEENQKKMFSSNANSKKKKGIFGKKEGIFRRVFGTASLRDTVGPLLVPCYDLATGATFVFSRADAVEIDSLDFSIADICAATCSPSVTSPTELSSIDGRTLIRALGGAAAIANPTAVAITHVLNNKQEFPLANSTEDLIVLSLGGGHVAAASSQPCSSKSEIFRIASEGTSDMVNQAVAMAFGNNSRTNYIRIQAHGNLIESNKNRLTTAEKLLELRNVESVLFRGTKVTEKTNAEKLQQLGKKLLEEHESRKMSLMPVVVMKQLTSPRTSSATTASSATLSSSEASISR